MTTFKPRPRITEELLDRIVGDTDPTELFQSGKLMAELQRSQRAGAA